MEAQYHCRRIDRLAGKDCLSGARNAPVAWLLYWIHTETWSCVQSLYTQKTQTYILFLPMNTNRHRYITFQHMHTKILPNTTHLYIYIHTYKQISTKTPNKHTFVYIQKFIHQHLCSYPHMYTIIQIYMQTIIDILKYVYMLKKE